MEDGTGGPGGGVTVVAGIVCAFGDEDTRRRTATALESIGPTVEAAGTTADALAALDGDVVCLVCGERFPDGDGVSLVEEATDRHPDLAVVLAPADGSESLANRALAAGAADYVPQSAGADEVADRVSTVLDASGDDVPPFRTLVEQATDMFGVLSAEGNLEYVSSSVEQVLGYDPSNLVGEDAFSFIHPEDVESVSEEYAAVLEDPNYRGQAEFRFQAADGEWRVLDARATNRLEDPSVRGIVVNARDVTERREREQELRTQRALIDGILTTIPDVVFAFDPEGEPLRQEQFLTNIVGYEPEEVAAMHPLEFIPEEDQDELAEHIERVLQEGGIRTAESALITKDGDRIPHEIKGARLTDEDGTILGVVGTARDISERLERERTLERQNERLKDFTSVVSHDLRSPLNVVIGRLQLAVDGKNPEENVRTALEAAERIDDLIEDLLSLTRQGQTIGDLRPVDLDAVAARATASIDSSLVRFDLEDLGTVLADGNRLQELLENLFRNAVDHATPAGQESRGEGACDPTDSDESAAETARQDIVTVTVGSLTNGFYVADDGPGIPASKREQVFEPGFTTAPFGTGLGLAIVSRIAEAHGWTVTVTENEEGGARFEIRDVKRPDRVSAGDESSTA